MKKTAKVQARLDGFTFRDVALNELNVRKPEWAEAYIKDTQGKQDLHILRQVGD